jgi:hypothetical protein
MPLGALLLLIRSHSKQTRYDEEPAAMAGNSQIFIDRIMHLPLFNLNQVYHFSYAVLEVEPAKCGRAIIKIPRP